jgi:4-diphosphocytidyl-2-C-methyl-D-erythritol kinase
VSSLLADIAPAKINLTLRVIGRRADGYHELESLVVFADVADRLTLVPGAGMGLAVTGPFAAACGAATDNLVPKAARELEMRLPDLASGHFRLDKHLPVAAGIGGGSSDAAAALRLLARANGIRPDDRRLAESARAVGADVPVCLDPRPRIMRGAGEILSAPFGLPPLPAVLANPRVPTATRDVFRAFAGMHGSAAPLDNPPRSGLIDYLQAHGNDLTAAAITCVPAIGDVLDALGALPGAQLARMSGSGSTCSALFDSPDAARAAAARLTTARPDWWVAATTLGTVRFDGRP